MEDMKYENNRKKEIDNLYKKVGLKPDYDYGISTKLNKGTLKTS